MTDLVERLRDTHEHELHRLPDDILLQAANEIERLQAALQTYGDHTYECSMKDTVGRCSCGYSRALGLNE